jgi:putative membrane protein
MVDVTVANSLNHSMDSALKHYSSLFFLPTLKKAIAAIALLCIGGVGLSAFALFHSVDGLINSAFLGFSLFAATLIFDYITSKMVLRRDPIYVLRRIVALSLFGWIVWLFFIALGVVFGLMFNFWWWFKLCLLGFAGVVTFRAVVFMATSAAGMLRQLSSSLLQPFLCIVAFMVFWTRFAGANPLQFLPFLFVSPIAGCASAFLFLLLLDLLGRRTYNMPSMPLFRAFMLNWVAGLNSPLEELLEKLGEDADVEVSFLKFDSSKPKAAIIVPLVHPGPFKNIGSSLLPSMLKHEFEKKFGCDACVPLGILGHELDLASQAQNQRIIDYVLTSAKFSASANEATPFVRVTQASATASCQVFGKIAFLSFTLAPKTTEDLPQELGRIVREEAGKHGLGCAIVVNAHNSIDGTVDIEESLGTLCAVASNCLKKVVSLPSKPFEVGAATVFPKEFTLKDGMGLGGITVIAVEVVEQKSAYVVIDGNNMISGLREEILSALTSMGFHEGEVFTTDTHAVSAVILGQRGYHPVGEAMSHEALIGYIKEAAKAAAAKLERCKAGCLTVVVPKVRVIGKARLESLTMLVDRVLQKAKQIVIPIFGFEGLFLILLLAIL